MSRPPRVFVEGGFFHVYNRTGRGVHAFAEAGEADAFVELLREVTKRDELTVFAWCLMSNHYHLAVKTGTVSLDRPIRSLQQRATRRFNVRTRTFGPMWQGRYRAKMINDQRYLDQLLIYIHLNPVQAGIVDDPAHYEWSGHNELLGRVKAPIVDVDEVLRVFGTSRRSARAAYVRRLKGAVTETWIGEQPGRLPWWRLGRPPKGEEDDPEDAVRERRQREDLGPEWRPQVAVTDLVQVCAGRLEIDLDDLRSRRKTQDVVRARELIALVGIERYRLRVKDLARVLGKTPDGMTQALARAVLRRTNDQNCRRRLDELDREVAEAAMAQRLLSD